MVHNLFAKKIKYMKSIKLASKITRVHLEFEFIYKLDLIKF